MPNICPDCVSEPTLKRRLIDIRPQYNNGPCSHHPTRKGIPVQAVAALFSEPLQFMYRRGGTDWEGDAQGDDLATIVAEAGEIDDWNVAEEIAHQLVADDPAWPPDGDEPFFVDDGGYESGGATDEPLTWAWEHFRQEIMEKHRFFSATAQQRLDQLFRGVENQRDSRGRSMVSRLAVGTRILRARIEDDAGRREQIRAEPWVHLAAPPIHRRRAGRMNAAGIPVFYGAFDLPTCVAELSPAVGSTVVSGEFELTRELLALDITRFSAPQRWRSPFSVGYVQAQVQRAFLRRFQDEISQPILDANSHLDYVPTQVVAEYLTSVLSVVVDGQVRRVDALIFRSSQRPDGKNIAIFGDAGLVRAGASTVAPPHTIPTRSAILPFIGGWGTSGGRSGLRIDAATVQEHRVTGSAFSLAEEADNLLAVDFDE